MRISDWSSDVCSSDLHNARWSALPASHSSQARLRRCRPPRPVRSMHRPTNPPAALRPGLKVVLQAHDNDREKVSTCPAPRSEEHTSELQSLMRISYAVFCLKKKKKQKHISTTQHTQAK